MKRKVIAVFLWLVALSSLTSLFSDASMFIGRLLTAALCGWGGYKLFQGEVEVDPSHPESMPSAARKKYDSMVAKLLNEAVHMPRDQFDVLIAGGIPAIYNTPAMLDGDDVVGHTGGGSGFRVKITKGVSYNVGASSRKSVYGDVKEQYRGQLIITNKKVVFVNAQKGFSFTLRRIHVVTAPDANSLTLQTGDKAFDLYVLLGPYLMQLIGKLKSGVPVQQ